MSASEEFLLGGFNARSPWKATCVAAATSPITLAGEQTIDDVGVEYGDRVLVTAQSSAEQNGIYVVSTGAWTRAADFRDERSAQLGATVLVSGGTADSGVYRMTSPASGAVAPGQTETTWTLVGAYDGTIANVDDGATKGSQIKRTVKPATAALTQGYAVVTDGATVKLGTPANVSAAGRISGLAVAAASASAQATIHTAGPIEPSIVNLGAGVACAVGVTSAGAPVRANDPTCVSHPHYLGDCDATGTITVAPRRSDTINIADLGAVADYVSSSSRGTDCSAYIQRAIRLLDPLRGGTVRIPYGRWRLSETVYVDRPVSIVGDGGDRRFGATAIFVDEGRTGFVFVATSQYAPDGVDGVNYAGAAGASMTGCKVVASARNTNTYAGTYDQSAASIVSVETPNDFQNGQLVRIPGAGLSTILCDGRVKITTTMGSPTATISGPFTSTRQGIHLGMWLRAGAGYATKAEVIAVPDEGDLVDESEYEITMSANAAASGTYEIEYVLDAFARIRSGAGTSTMVLDYAIGEDTPEVQIAHGDAGVYVQNNVTIQRCSFGTSDDTVLGHEFQGACVVISASVGWAPTGGYNANNWRLDYVQTYGGKGYGVVVQGSDTNNGLATMLDTIASPVEPRWAIVDASALGCNWVGCHTSGGFGMLTLGAQGVSFPTVRGLYAEVGTVCSFGDGTIADGDVASSYNFGGYTNFGGVQNRSRLGRVGDAAEFSVMEQRFEPDVGIAYRAPAAKSDNKDLQFRPLRPGDAAPASYEAWGWHHTAQNASAPFMVTDAANTVLTNMVTHAWDAGNGVCPRGLWIGGGTGMLAGGLSELTTDTRYLGFWHDAPTSGYRTWFRGDRCINSRLDAADDHINQWVCTVGGNPGTWIADVIVQRQTAPTQSYTTADSGTINSGDATTDAVIANMRTRIAELVLAVAELRTKLAAANVTE